METVDLSRYNNDWYSPGRGVFVRLLWVFASALLVQNPLVLSSRLRVWVLRAFGARIGRGVVIKPGVNVKYPWHLSIGDHSWIGESAWLDCLTTIEIGSNACVSQGAYLCTGNHSWSDPAFGLLVKPIVIEDGAWVGAKAVVAPGARLASHCVLTAASMLGGGTEPFGIYSGNPAKRVKERVISCGSKAPVGAQTETEKTP